MPRPLVSLMVALTTSAQVFVALPAPAQEAKAPITVKVGLPSNGVSGWLGKYAIEKGFGRKFGLDIQPLWVPVTDVERLMSIGELEVGQVALESTMRARVRGVPVRLVAPFAGPHWRVVVRKDAPYQKLEDLKGKRVGSMRQVTSTFNNFDYITRKRGNPRAEEFYQMIFGEPAALVTFMDKGDVEAVVVIEANVTRLLATGRYRVLVNIDEEPQKYIGAPYVGIWLAANDKWLQKNAEAARRLLDTVLAANAKARGDEAFFKEAAKPLFGLTKPEELDMAWKRTSPYAVVPASWPDRKMFDAQIKYIDSLIEIGALPAAAKASTANLFWTP